jgi:putative oxidoreductase
MTPPLSLPQRVLAIHDAAGAWIDRLQPLFAIAIRLYVAKVFFFSGLTKLRDWDITIALFTNEYHVPVLPPEVAAFLGTGAELLLPVLLAAGIFSRFTALALFAFNIVAATSYPDISDAGIVQHTLWGAMLLVTFVYGPGRFAVDSLLPGRPWVQRHFA